MPSVTSFTLSCALVLLIGAADSRGSGSSDLTLIRDRFLLSIIPPDHRIELPILTAASGAAAALQPDGSWADIDYSNQARSQWSAGQHLARALIMAKGVAVSRRNNHPNPDLTAKTSAALTYWLDRDFRNPNWWWNEIGVPQLLGEIILLIDD